jgi:hypothetical protein
MFPHSGLRLVGVALFDGSQNQTVMPDILLFMSYNRDDVLHDVFLPDGLLHGLDDVFHDLEHVRVFARLHQGQRSGQPLKNNRVRIPAPS